MQFETDRKLGSKEIMIARRIIFFSRISYVSYIFDVHLISFRQMEMKYIGQHPVEYEDNIVADSSFFISVN